MENNQGKEIEKPGLLDQKVQGPARKVLGDISHYPEPEELYQKIVESPGWLYKTRQDFFRTRDRSLCSLLYLGDLRIIELLPLTEGNFVDKKDHILVQDIRVGKKRASRVVYRNAKLPLKGPRKCFTELILDYLKLLDPGARLFPWSLERIKIPIANSFYLTAQGEKKQRYRTTLVGTVRAWQIVNAVLPEYTQHWLRAFGYNFDYDAMHFDILAVSDKTKADPRSLQPYLRRRYEKYPVR